MVYKIGVNYIMKQIEKLAIIINKAYAQGIYEAEDLATYIVKSGISINSRGDWHDGYMYARMRNNINNCDCDDCDDGHCCDDDCHW